GQGFREQPGLWPKAILEGGKCKWIILKMAEPVAQGMLWEYLIRNHAEHLIVVLTADDLRLTEVQISRELSWERTSQDLVWELTHNPRVNSFTQCAHVVVSFETTGAILLSGQKDQQDLHPDSFLFFDPAVIEGTWRQDYPGGMYGYTCCFVSSLVNQLLISADEPDIHQAVQSGLSALRELHLAGFGEATSDISSNKIEFPVDHIAEMLIKKEALFAKVVIQNPLRFLEQTDPEGPRPLKPGYWTILEDIYQDDLVEMAQRIVLDGPQLALKEIPLGKFGHLLTMDRREIESFRSFRTLVSEYIRQGRQKRPLNIAVFGAPGSGKSFGVIQVAGSLLPGQIEVLEFNLSQMVSVDNFTAALHQVRDIGLSNKIPLVFWDEFDSALDGNPLGWLRYFLAPMQDGSFTVGQTVHPIGRAIFVFAGGTSRSLDDFEKVLPKTEFRDAKGPDFISRLKGFINIMGPNPQKDGQPARANEDPYFIIRRAILLHSIFKRNTPHLFVKRSGKETLNIDLGVLWALLQTNEYKHGIRSIESIIALSMLAEKPSFERSSLPSETQLDLHVDGQEFLALVQQLTLEGDLLERLAVAAHAIYCDGLRKRGYTLGPQNDEALKTAYALRPFDELSEELKEQNRSNVIDISKKLARIGYFMVPARSNEHPFDFPGGDLDKLSQWEHERWMQEKLATDWVYGLETDPDKRVHSSLVPWGELPEAEKEKDRDLVKGIPKIIFRAGYTIVKSKRHMPNSD
ncbi:MAG: RyR domain-containing protein, partial [Anaerolineaceae bacterium]|nr:RyR domain-containing protein [Anaerolineaceae bacterium]